MKILGFLYHDLLAKESSIGSSGNYAIEDQRAAFEWVHRNIEKFGGDKNQITISGVSAGKNDLRICGMKYVVFLGAVSVFIHLVSPFSKGLFKRGIMQSGTCPTYLESKQEAHKTGKIVEEYLGCKGQSDVLACMRSKDAREVVQKYPALTLYAFDEGAYCVRTCESMKKKG